MSDKFATPQEVIELTAATVLRSFQRDYLISFYQKLGDTVLVVMSPCPSKDTDSLDPEFVSVAIAMDISPLCGGVDCANLVELRSYEDMRNLLIAFMNPEEELLYQLPEYIQKELPLLFP